MEFEKLQEIFKVLGHESRLRILQLLTDKSYCGEELAKMLSLSSATISHHMKKLEEVGLVKAVKEQYYTNYYVNDEALNAVLNSGVFAQVVAQDREAEERHAEYREKILKDFFDQQGKLKSIPGQHKKREVVLQKLAEAFEPEHKYSEMEVNLTLAKYHDDFCTLRRELIAFRLMERNEGQYWRLTNVMEKRREEFTLEDLLEVMLAEAGILRPEEKVQQIALHHRIQNSPGIDAALDNMANELLSAGILTRIECFKSDNRLCYQDYLTPGGWVAKMGQLRLHETGEVLANFQAGPIQLIQHSCSTAGREVLEVYVVDNLEQIRQEKPDLRGKILLTNQNVHMVKDLIHDPLGARGIIFDGMRASTVREGDMMRHARQYTSFWWLPEETPTFGFVVTPGIGADLRTRVKAGERIMVECEVETEFFNNTLKVLHARIPGKTNENLLLVAHICHPHPSVNDNASGAGAGVECMLFIQDLLNRQIISTPDRGIELLLVPEFSGSFAFLDRYLKTGNYLAGLNLDMVGEDQEKCGSTLNVETPPLMTPGLTGDFLYHIVTKVMGPHNFRMQKVGFTGGSDHALLSDPRVGIPCPMLIQLPDRYYHTDQDTLDKLDPVILKDVTLTSAAYLYYLANAHLNEVKEMLQVYQEGFLEAVKAEIAEVLERVERGPLPNGLLPFCNRQVMRITDRYTEVTDYFKRFIRPEEFNYFQKVATDWRKFCETERGKLVKVMNQQLTEMIKANPELAKDNAGPRGLNEVERELAQLVPERKYWGTTVLTHKRHLVPQERLAEIWELIEQDAQYVSVIAQYLADGQRNLFEIMEIIEMEIGTREPEFLKALFMYLQEVGSVELKQKKKK